MSNKKKLLISLGILLFAAVVTILIFMTEPEAQSESATKETAMLVEVVSVERGNYNPVIVATGTVQPVEDVMLSAQVSGQVITRSQEFEPGGFVRKGEVLLQIDPSDYQNNLELRRSELVQMQTELNMEMGRQQVAEQDLKLVGMDSLSQEERSLVLRQPQLRAVRARIDAARAAVEQAELQLARTTIRAPFDAHILNQNVTTGSQIAIGDNLGRLVGTENYWINLTVPVNKLQWMHFPKAENEVGAPVKIKNTTAWTGNTFRRGFLSQQIGALDDQTRLARILVKVPDPLAQQNENKDKPQLMIGTFVEAQIQAKEIKNVVRLNRDYVRTNQTVWVMEDGKLSIREVEIILTDSEYAYIKNGLNDEEKVVTTNLSTVAEGIRLRTEKNIPEE